MVTVVVTHDAELDMDVLINMAQLQAKYLLNQPWLNNWSKQELFSQSFFGGVLIYSGDRQSPLDNHNLNVVLMCRHFSPKDKAELVTMMVIVFVIAHEGSLITRDTISNNISNPPFEPQSESAISTSNRDHLRLTPSSNPIPPLTPSSSVYLMPLCEPRLKWCWGKKSQNSLWEVKWDICVW